jgi:hypothetical protein
MQLPCPVIDEKLVFSEHVPKYKEINGFITNDLAGKETRKGVNK